jgi:hypothetical protein
MALLSILLAAAGASATVGLVPAAEVALPDRRIRLGDVAELGGLAPAERQRLAPRVIALVPAGRSRIVLTREALRGLVRRSVPGLAVRAEAEESSLTFTVAQPLEGRPPPTCAEVARPVSAGAPVSGEDLVPAPCRATAASVQLRFDRANRIVRASGPLAVGDYLGRISVGSALPVDKGDKLSLVASSGPVRVSREVVAMQAGRAGGRLFVRDSEGNVTSAPLALGTGK